MKKISRNLLFFPLWTFSVLASPLAAQTSPTGETKQVATQGATIDISNSPIITQRLTTSLELHWSARYIDNVQVNIPNSSDRDWRVSGVQTSANFFVVSFDSTIPAHSTGKVILNYDASENSDTSREMIRIKTNYGIKAIDVNLSREKVASFDQQNLQWFVGEPISTKSVNLTLSKGTAVIKRVTVGGGAGHRSEFVDLGGGNYRIDVTPKSADKSAQFPVFIEFTPALPGVGSVIMCSILTKS